jgi:ABC-type amino acid transport substrate-binding protein
MSSIRCLCLHLVSALSLLSAVSIADPATASPENTAADNPLKVCSFELAPYYYKDGDKYRGILVDIIDQISANLDLTPQYSMMPPLRCARHVFMGSKDLMPFASGFMDKLIYTHTPVHFYIAGFIVEDSSDKQEYLGMEQFKGQSVGLLRGNPQTQELKQYTDIQWVQVNSGKSQWRMLLSKRLDAAFGDLVALTALEPYRNGQVRFLTPAYSSSPMWMGFHPDREVWRYHFDRQLEAMLADGTISKIYNKHSSLSFEEIQSLTQLNNQNP